MVRLSVLAFLLVIAATTSNAQLSTKSKKAIELYTEADNYRVRGQFQQAIRLLNEAIEKDDDFVEAYHRLGLVYYNMRTYAKAIEKFEKGLSISACRKCSGLILAKRTFLWAIMKRL
jgi:OmpA-OmpF porin, OOP family